MASTTFKQEMPPVGGYKPLNFERVFPKRFNTFLKFNILTWGCSAAWFYFFRIVKREDFMQELEDRNDLLGIEPCMCAERDREFLRQMRRNRQEEEDLMKNYPNWVTGTYFGEPLYKTIPEDYLIKPELYEYYIHTRLKYLSEYSHVELLY